MMGVGLLETLLSAVLEAGVSLVAEVGFGDDVKDLKDKLSRKDEKKRREAFLRAMAKAAATVDEKITRPLLEHGPFREEVIAALLDPRQTMDFQAVADMFEDRYPKELFGERGDRYPQHLRALRSFFTAIENALVAEPLWGPVLDRFQNLRLRREVEDALKEKRLNFSTRELAQKLSPKLALPEPDSAGGGSEGEIVGDSHAGAADVLDPARMAPPQAVGVGPTRTAAVSVAALVDRGSDVHQVVQLFVRELILACTPPDRSGAPRRSYLQELATDCNLLPWSCFKSSQADPCGGEDFRLADVYTDLYTTELNAPDQRRIGCEEELRQFLSRIHEAKRIPAQEMANRERRLLILGDPGSGKSTFMNFLAYVLAQAGLMDDPSSVLARLSPWEHGPILPVRVELRNLATYADKDEDHGGNGSASLLLSYLRKMLSDWQLDGFWPELNKALREEGQPMLILLDGMDEVPTARRQMIVDTVNDFSRRYNAHRYMITCRPYAYVGQPWRLQGFRAVTLAPFNEEQIDRFVGSWYERLAERGRFRRPEAGYRAERLHRALKCRDLMCLAERPLLLTIMAQLDAFKGELPDDRTQLYAEAVELLLHRWENRIGSEAGILERLNIPGFKMSDLEAGLYRVAYEAHARQQSEGETADVGEGDLLVWLKPYLGNDLNKAQEFVNYIRERAGLLIRHKKEAYTFPHRTFQEFLAACHLMSLNNYPGEAEQLVVKDLDRWREVFVLASGHAARTHQLRQSIAAVNAICPRGADDDRTAAGDPQPWRLARLAGEALLEIGLVGVQRGIAGTTVLDRVRSWLATAIRRDDVLSAVDRVASGRILAKLGDPRKEVMTVDAMEFCHIPGGPFIMDSRIEFDDRRLAKSHRTVDIPYHFLISKYPVTNSQFREFIDAGGYANGSYWGEVENEGIWTAGKVKCWENNPTEYGSYDYGEPFNLSNHPVVGVTWYAAFAFTRWLTERLLACGKIPAGWVARLAYEEEWEKSARGGIRIPDAMLEWAEHHPQYDNPQPMRTYPWGDSHPDPDRANYDDANIKTTNAVGCFLSGRSPYGVEEMAGNVWEWCSNNVVRGGSWQHTAHACRVSSRGRHVSELRLTNIGFRVILSTDFRDFSDNFPSLESLAVSDDQPTIRQATLESIVHNRKDEPSTAIMLTNLSQSDPDSNMRQTAIRLLARNCGDLPGTLDVLKRLAAHGDSGDVRQAALQELVMGWSEESSVLPMLFGSISNDRDSLVRQTVLEELVYRWRSVPGIFTILEERAKVDPDASVRNAAIQGLARTWPGDSRVSALLRTCAMIDESPAVRGQALQELFFGYGHDPGMLPYLGGIVLNDPSGDVRLVAITHLAQWWKDSPDTLEILKDRFANDPDERIRCLIVKKLATTLWPDGETRDILFSSAENDTSDEVRATSCQELSRLWWRELRVRRWLRSRVVLESGDLIRQRLARTIESAETQVSDYWAAKLSGTPNEGNEPEMLPGYPGFRVSRFRLRNIGPFRDTEEVELQKGINLFLGDNAAGKTTILRCLALAAIGLTAANEVEDDPSAYLRKGAQRGTIEVLFEVIPDPDVLTTKLGYFSVGLQITDGSSRFAPMRDSDMTLRPTRPLAEKLSNSAEHLGVLRSVCSSQFGFVSGYGALRSFGDSRFATQTESKKRENEWVLSLFKPNAWLVDPEIFTMLIRGDTSNIEDAPLGELSVVLQDILHTNLKHIFPEVKTFFMEGDDDLQLNGAPLRFGELSDGYRSLFALLGHLLRCSLKVRKWEDDPTQIDGIALIDEMDLHLHPTWQHHVVQDFRRAFPNIQLIASTHSPLVVGALKREDVLIMRRMDDGAMVVEHPEFDPQGQGAAGILTSAFDLSSTIDQPTLDKITRRCLLYSKRRVWTQPEQQEYAALIDELAKLGFNREFSDPYFEKFATAMAKRHEAALGRLTPQEKLELDAYADKLLNDIMNEDGK